MKPVLLPYAPTNDIIFKAMFGHHSDPDLILLKDFLFALTGQYPTSILSESHEINTDYPETKDIRLDLRVLLDGNVYPNIEMQKFMCTDESAKAFAYLCISVSDNIEKGKSYSEMIPVCQIFILNYVLFPDKSEGIHTFMMSDIHDHTLLTDKGMIIMMEMPKVINEITGIQTMTHLQKWAYFLKFGNRIDDSIIQAITKENPFDKAMEVVKMVNSDKKTKDAAFARMRYSMDEAQARYEGKTEGKAEGFSEGKAVGFQLASLIMAMLRSQISFDEIIEKTGATMDDVLSIYTSMNEPVLTIQEKTN